MKCNRNLSGNAVEYRIRLVPRIGAEKVVWLEGPHPARKYTVEEIKAIKAEYRAKTRELKGRAA
ncbi:Bacteriophage Lambda NinG protein [compost metagenome]